MVVAKFFASWCGPCWNYHQTHALEDLWNDYGPGGTNEVIVFGLESDISTNEQCLYGQQGCNGTSLGDWTVGVTYPMANITDPSIPGGYSITYFPTIATICSDGLVYESGQLPASSHANWIASCLFEGEFISSSEVTCFEDQNGAIDIDYSGGHGSIWYLWSNGAGTQDLQNASAGTYSVTLTEGNGIQKVLDNLVIEGPTQELILSVDGTDDVDCFGDATGFINTNANGGTPGYTFMWSTGETTPNISDLPAGNYSLTVTDANGCEKEISEIISEPPQLTLSLDAENETCDGQNGSIICQANGGTPGYTFDIGNGPSPGGAFLNLEAGDYTVTITDLLGCSEEQQATLTNTPAPDADAGPEKEIDCDNTTAQLEGSGDEGPDFLIEWIAMDGGNIVEGASSLTPVVNAPGTYELQIRNTTNNCITVDQVVVTQIGELPVADAGEDKHLDCATSSVVLDGSASSSGSNYSYSWETSGGNIVEGENTNMATVDEPGIYTLFVTNADNNCETSAIVEVTGDFETPEIIIQETEKITCTNSTVIIDASESTSGDDISVVWTTDDGNIVEGGTSYLPEVDQPGTYMMEIHNEANNCSSVFQISVEEDTRVPNVSIGDDKVISCNETEVTISAEVSNVGDNLEITWATEDGNIVNGSDQFEAVADQAGMYEFTVVNLDNGCIANASLQVTLDQEVPVSDAGLADELTCTRTSITLDGSASDQGDELRYQWTTADGNIVNGENTLQPEIDAPGTYVLEVLNLDNECSSTSSVLITEFINTPVAEFEYATDELSVDFQNLSEGNPDQVTWDFGDGNQSVDPEPIHQFSAAGTYEVCLTITNECGNDTKCYDVSVSLSGISVDPDIRNVSCHGGDDGSISIDILSGNAPYAFNWSDGSEEKDNDQLEAGTYRLTITDSEGNNFEFEYEISEPDAIEVFDVQVINEINEDPGSITINVRGGTAPYSFEWSDGSTDKDLVAVEAGDYELTITDGNGCETKVGPFTIETVTSVKEIESLEMMQLLPNPGGQQTLLNLKFKQVEHVRVEVYTINGQLVAEQAYESDEFQVAIGRWVQNSGIYMVRISTEAGSEFMKWIVP
jgi:hypothetical protein